MPKSSLGRKGTEVSHFNCQTENSPERKLGKGWVNMTTQACLVIALCLLAFPSQCSAQQGSFSIVQPRIPSMAPATGPPSSTALFWRNLVATGGRSVPVALSPLHPPLFAPAYPDDRRPQQIASVRQDASFGQLPLTQVLSVRAAGISDSNPGSSGSSALTGAAVQPSAERGVLGTQSISDSVGGQQNSQSTPGLTLTPVQLLPSDQTSPSPSAQTSPSPASQATPSPPTQPSSPYPTPTPVSSPPSPLSSADSSGPWQPNGSEGQAGGYPSPPPPPPPPPPYTSPSEPQSSSPPPSASPSESPRPSPPPTTSPEAASASQGQASPSPTPQSSPETYSASSSGNAGPATVQVVVQLNGNNIGPIAAQQDTVSRALREVLSQQFGSSVSVGPSSTLQEVGPAPPFTWQTGYVTVPVTAPPDELQKVLGAIIDRTQNQEVAGYIRQFGFYPVDKAYLSTVQVSQSNRPPDVVFGQPVDLLPLPPVLPLPPIPGVEVTALTPVPAMTVVPAPAPFIGPTALPPPAYTPSAAVEAPSPSLYFSPPPALAPQVVPSPVLAPAPTLSPLPLRPPPSLMVPAPAPLPPEAAVFVPVLPPMALSPALPEASTPPVEVPGLAPIPVPVEAPKAALPPAEVIQPFPPVLAPLQGMATVPILAPVPQPAAPSPSMETTIEAPTVALPPAEVIQPFPPVLAPAPGLAKVPSVAPVPQPAAPSPGMESTVEAPTAVLPPAEVIQPFPPVLAPAPGPAPVPAGPPMMRPVAPSPSLESTEVLEPFPPINAPGPGPQELTGVKRPPKASPPARLPAPAKSPAKAPAKAPAPAPRLRPSGTPLPQPEVLEPFPPVEAEEGFQPTETVEPYPPLYGDVSIPRSLSPPIIRPLPKLSPPPTPIPVQPTAAGQPVQLGVALTGPGINQVPDAQIQESVQQAIANQTGLSPSQIDVTVGPSASGRRLLADSTTTVAVVLHPTQEQAQQLQRKVENLTEPSNSEALVNALQNAGLPVTKASVTSPVTVSWKPPEVAPAPGPAPESKVNVTTGIGIALGALVVLCLLGALAWWYFTKTKNDSLVAKAKAASTQKAQERDKQKMADSGSTGTTPDKSSATKGSARVKSVSSSKGTSYTTNGVPSGSAKGAIDRTPEKAMVAKSLANAGRRPQTADDDLHSAPTRNANVLVTPPSKRSAKLDGTPPSTGSRAWETPVDIEKLEREHKKLLREAQYQRDRAEAASRAAEQERLRAEEKEKRLVAAQAHASSLEEKIAQLERQAARAATRISPKGSPRANRNSDSEAEKLPPSARSSGSGTNLALGLLQGQKSGKPKERLAQLEAEEQQLEEALEATHHELANTSARLRAVEAELEQAEAEAALHRSAAEHAAAIAEKYAEERDSSRAELERLKLEALQREQDLQRRLDEAVVEAQQAAARARALTEEREALRNLLKALRSDQARGKG
eukprot:jgi/Botrbrau1/6592/Bobra.0189s0019.1